MPNRTFVTLAHDYRDENLEGWYLSEKIDGMRCFWDGIGPRTEIPAFANKVRGSVTGLWTRYGNVFNAPEWFTDNLPRGVMLDGELFAGSLSETKRLKTIIPDDSAWEKAQFHVFDVVPLYAFGSTGRINNPYFVNKQIVLTDYLDYPISVKRDLPFVERLAIMKELLTPNDSLIVVPYELLSNTDEAFKKFVSIVEDGGEGVVVRCPNTRYQVKRSRKVLRIKQQNVGIVKILEVSLNPRSVLVEWGDLRFRIGSGLRVLPRVGEFCNFTFAGLTDDGIPREARIC